MQTQINPNDWIYIIVTNPNKNEQIFGQFDFDSNTAFILTFENKSAAKKNIETFYQKIIGEYEIQAIIYEDLVNYTKKENFSIFIIDENGKIKTRLDP